MEYIYDDITDELGNILDYKKELSYVLMKIYEKTEIPFVIIIDEWIVLAFENSNDQALVHKYLQFLHSLLNQKNQNRLFWGYITGILTLTKKIKDESAFK